MWYFELENRKKIFDISSKNKTPFYLYHIPTLLMEVEKYKKTFSQYNVRFYYALKANYNLELLNIIRKNGFGADVVSGGELRQAILAGFKNIVFSGTGKTEEELSLAIKEKIDFINIESFEEFKKIESICKKTNSKVNISVRVNPGVEVDTHSYIATATKYSKFGVDFSTAFEIYKKARSLKRYFNITGIHFHLGSQIFSFDVYSIALKKVLNFLKRLRENNIIINTIDIGGGMGVKEGEMADGHSKLLDIIKPYCKMFNFIIEPGRSVVASCGAVITRVLYRKKTGKRYIVIVDAGMNDLIRPALYQVYHPVYNLNIRRTSKLNLDIAGPLCESSDFFARSIKMPLPLQNDLLLISSTGAYGYSMASNYNLREKIKEILIQ